MIEKEEEERSGPFLTLVRACVPQHELTQQKEKKEDLYFDEQQATSKGHIYVRN